MSSYFRALLLALALHVLLGVAIGLVVDRIISPSVELPSLDLSAVELSLSDEEKPDASAQVLPPSAPAEPVAAAPSLPPPSVQDAMAEPPAPDGVKLSDPPAESAPEMILPEVRKDERAKEEIKEAAPKTPAAEAAPRQARIEEPKKPELKRRIKPVYPESSLRKKEKGVVELDIEVDVRGVAVSLSVAVSSGFPALDAAALKAAAKAEFNPATSQGKPVASRVRLPIVFSLRNR
jgi:protein TonB